MHLPRAVLRTPVVIPRDAVLRLLGIRRDKRPPRPSLRTIIDEELDAAGGLIAPQVVLQARMGLPGSRTFDPELPLALAVCTVGAAIDARAEAHVDRGESARALVLHAIGAAAVEELADVSNGRICALALEAGQQPDTRRSPGYGRWPLTEQRLIFDELRPEEIGVTLTEASLMIPSKSISFVVPLAGGDPKRRARKRCERCGLVTCEYRLQRGERAQ